MKYLWFLSGAAVGFTVLSLSMASVAPPHGASPIRGRVTDDTALYQSLSEIRVGKSGKVDSDREIQRLVQLESRYHEALPRIDHRDRLKGPMQRIAQQKYRYSGRSGTARAASN